ncbi:hypothetical protein [uncultured Chryseobacterium sp.]|uniref:hypothetical protein n=1 Tax=uncultured Chryseobacterium sp. TaxID=259322 RepID=UPI0025E48CC5|nr:hypothetical protein [uncultured Chryseobacterium sp.]
MIIKQNAVTTGGIHFSRKKLPASGFPLPAREPYSDNHHTFDSVFNTGNTQPPASLFQPLNLISIVSSN